MKQPVDLYDSHYGQTEAEVYRAVRVEAFGEDFGQTSWMTAAECDGFCGWLGLRAGQRMLEVACGSGGTAVRIAERFGVSVVGVDINPSAVLAATNRASASAVHDRVEFQVADANDALPFPAESFDALFSNDAINHLRDRTGVLADWHRVLRPGGRCLYTDPIVVTGWLSNAEIEARSSVGFFLFTPKGVNETLIRTAGFRLVLTADVTASVARTSQRWYEARSKRRAALCELEGETRFEELQQFLSTAHTLAREGRLSRLAFMGEKNGADGQALPPGSGGSMLAPEVHQSDSPQAAPIRITDDPTAPAYRVIDPDKTHPFRQKELIAEVRGRLPEGVGFNSFDVVAIRRVHGVDDMRELSYKPTFGSRQYSGAFADWLVAQDLADALFFEKARVKYREG